MPRRVPDLPEALVGKHLQEALDSCQETDTRPASSCWPDGSA